MRLRKNFCGSRDAANASPHVPFRRQAPRKPLARGPRAALPATPIPRASRPIVRGTPPGPPPPRRLYAIFAYPPNQPACVPFLSDFHRPRARQRAGPVNTRARFPMARGLPRVDRGPAKFLARDDSGKPSSMTNDCSSLPRLAPAQAAYAGGRARATTVGAPNLTRHQAAARPADFPGARGRPRFRRRGGTSSSGRP